MTDGIIHTQLSDDGGYTIIIDRPEKGNALTSEMTSQLAEAFSKPPEGARFIVLSGQGSDFCAGRDSPMPKAGQTMSAEAIRARVADPVLAFYETIRNVSLPVICVVRGRAYGVGCALAGLGDIIIADETADFCIPEMNRDIPPLLVGTALADRLPRAALSRMIYGRESVDAQSAVVMGLASEAVTSDELEARIATWRGLLSQNSKTILSTVKRFLNVTPELGFQSLREYAAVSNSAAVSERFIDPNNKSKK